ncbi:uncharacterized protein N7515_005817 [Penicillium bovifimosum]|uniref:Uncharacterized protein n=1 Tax=Penicillium bovifimosum TaxID=126998 RepID=A0A9W9GTT0_9EURO|nr:uncharacterized protein N7515_005817 [Penicillium bovifimosum]KAJ5129778.1 hypothetical protein N7515_005817 [Penicillium bovifimosum]
MTALEKAGSLFTGWIRSCWACLAPEEDCQTSRKVESNAGVEREMNVCHTQPHLVPPMKLVVYDDLPSPSIHHHRVSLSRGSLSSWINDGRQLASRASNRASMSLKRTSTTPLTISAPSDFRRVQSFYDHPAPSYHCPPAPTYQPLDLRIHRSGHRLSDLPSFETFEFDDGTQRKTLSAPPRALTTSTGVRDRHRQMSLVLSRKPVGSRNRRSLGNLEPLLAKEPVRITSALIPHFSKVVPVEIQLPDPQESSPVHGRSKSEGTRLTLNNTLRPDDANIPWGRVPQTPPASKSLTTDSPDVSSTNSSPVSGGTSSRASLHTMPTQVSSRRPSILSPETRNTRESTSSSSSSLSNRVTRWMFPTSSKLPPIPKQPSPPGEYGINWERARTLSGTTVASNTTTITGGRKGRNNSSISSAFSSAMTPRASFQVSSSTAEKEIDAGVCYPTIFEGQQQHHKLSAYRGDGRVRPHESGIGLAF